MFNKKLKEENKKLKEENKKINKRKSLTFSAKDGRFVRTTFTSTYFKNPPHYITTERKYIEDTYKAIFPQGGNEYFNETIKHAVKILQVLPLGHDECLIEIVDMGEIK